MKLQIIEGELMQTIVLGGGCFWCVEGALLGLKGVSKVIPGYSGGHTENPTYEEAVSYTHLRAHET